MPGVPRAELSRGAVVELLNRAPLTLGQGRNRRTWRAIAVTRYLGKRVAGAEMPIEAIVIPS